MNIASDAVMAVKAHHAELEWTLTSQVDAVVTAARDGRDHSAAVLSLRRLLDRDIVPHARAEEDVLYAAADAAGLRPLVRGMVFEHEALLDLATQLRAAPTAVDAVAVASAVRAVFVGHVRRENELLLPALAADPSVDLAALLPVMHDRFATYQAMT